MKAMATGIPTAQPMMRGSFDFFSSEVGEGALVLEDGGVKVVTCVEMRVVTPSAPEETLVLVEVMGVGVGVDDCSFVTDWSDEDEDGELLEEGELPPSDTRPVMVARLGALLAVVDPMMAYC